MGIFDKRFIDDKGGERLREVSEQMDENRLKTKAISACEVIFRGFENSKELANAVVDHVMWEKKNGRVPTLNAARQIHKALGQYVADRPHGARNEDDTIRDAVEKAREILGV